MKTPIILIVSAAVIIIVAAGAYMFTQNTSKSSDTMMKTDQTMMPKDEKSSQTTDMMEEDKKVDSAYIEYTKSAFENSSANRRVLFFYASWCSTCKPADASFMQNMNKIPEDVTLIRVNYNDPDTDQEEKDLAKKYGVTYQHTFVQIDSSGKEITKWNGGQIDELLSQIE